MQLVDSHCHLDCDHLLPQLDAALARANEAGVTKFLGIFTHKDGLGQGYKNFETVIRDRENVYGALGIHPHDAGNHTTLETENLVTLLNHPKLVGVGESGLDYHYDFSSPADQKLSFEKHIEAAQQTNLPLIIHTREAERDTVDILQKYMAAQPFRALFHCFTGSHWLAEAALEMGAYISFSGVLTFNKAEELRTVAKDVPLDKTLVETDSPYLAPVPYRGKPCEPAYVIETAKELADLKGISLEQIATKTTQNFHTLFNKVPRI